MYATQILMVQQLTWPGKELLTSVHLDDGYLFGLK